MAVQGGGSSDSVKRVRLEVRTGNPNLQGIRSTINVLGELTGTLRKLNAQAGLLKSQTGFDFGGIGPPRSS